MYKAEYCIILHNVREHREEFAVEVKPFAEEDAHTLNIPIEIPTREAIVIEDINHKWRKPTIAHWRDRC